MLKFGCLWTNSGLIDKRSSVPYRENCKSDALISLFSFGSSERSSSVPPSTLHSCSEERGAPRGSGSLSSLCLGENYPALALALPGNPLIWWGWGGRLWKRDGVSIHVFTYLLAQSVTQKTLKSLQLRVVPCLNELDLLFCMRYFIFFNKMQPTLPNVLWYLKIIKWGSYWDDL